MSNILEIKIPDIGDFEEVAVIEVLVKPGDRVQVEDSLITLESDKATMDVPSPAAGTIKEVRVKVGDKVAEGALVLLLDAVDAVAASAFLMTGRVSETADGTSLMAGRTSEVASETSLSRDPRLDPISEASRASVSARGPWTRVPGAPPATSLIGESVFPQ